MEARCDGIPSALGYMMNILSLLLLDQLCLIAEKVYYIQVEMVMSNRKEFRFVLEIEWIRGHTVGVLLQEGNRISKKNYSISIALGHKKLLFDDGK